MMDCQGGAAVLASLSSLSIGACHFGENSVNTTAAKGAAPGSAMSLGGAVSLRTLPVRADIWQTTFTANTNTLKATDHG
jgi:hypothetical protein